MVKQRPFFCPRTLSMLFVSHKLLRTRTVSHCVFVQMPKTKQVCGQVLGCYHHTQISSSGKKHIKLTQVSGKTALSFNVFFFFPFEKPNSMMKNPLNISLNKIWCLDCQQIHWIRPSCCQSFSCHGLEQSCAWGGWKLCFHGYVAPDFLLITQTRDLLMFTTDNGKL